MKVSIGSDHAGFALKKFLIDELSECGYTMIDCGTDNYDSVDYPDYAAKACKSVTDGEAELGIVVCSTGIGVSIAANKMRGVRAALCHTEFSAKMARLHNDANVLALGGNVLGRSLALSVAETFLGTEFSHAERHIRRITKMSGLEDSACS